MLKTLEAVSMVAPLDQPVLVVGERGTCKELIAARLHYLSNRWEGQFLKLNCAAINDSLLETELFGHEAGAFTGATRAHQGRFEQADGGTLFLDELANTSGLVQEKLLRVIEYGEFERVGGNKTLQCDVRLVAATHRNLKQMDLAFKYYKRSIALNPRHRGAHEYIGEAYLMMHDLPGAERHLVALRSICLLPCEELADLETAITEYRARRKHAAKP